MNTEQTTQMLRDDVGRAIAASHKRTEDLRAFAALLDKVQGSTAPTAECKKLLNYYGFCVLTRDQFHAITGLLAAHLEHRDFQTNEERQAAEALLADVEKEAACAIRR
jgi:hypothetical protein